MDIELIYEHIEKYADFYKEIKKSGNVTYSGKDQDKEYTNSVTGKCPTGCVKTGQIV